MTSKDSPKETVEYWKERALRAEGLILLRKEQHLARQRHYQAKRQAREAEATPQGEEAPQ